MENITLFKASGSHFSLRQSGLLLVYVAADVSTEFYLQAFIILVILWVMGLLLPVKKNFSQQED